MKRISVLLSVLFLAACGGRDQSADQADQLLAGAPGGALVASVGAETISEPLLNAYAQGRGLAIDDPAQRQQALDALIDSLLLAREALDNDAAAQPDVQANLALLRVQYLANRALLDFQQSSAITDAQVLDYYNEETQRSGTVEWHLEHILFADEASAQAVAARAQGGENFAALMQEYAGSSLQARSLGWATRPRMPPELADAAVDLPDGAVTPMPVKTQYGWHVLHRVGTRAFTPPPFAEVQEGARRRLAERAQADYIASLRAKNQIAVGASAPDAGG
ncbi:MAG: peptidyl-prolyl cis-trans isomerase [Lysobacteraceae bacterium]